jgi:hypothetical protein
LIKGVSSLARNGVACRTAYIGHITDFVAIREQGKMKAVDFPSPQASERAAICAEKERVSRRNSVGLSSCATVA